MSLFSQINNSLPATIEQLLVSGGDARIKPDPYSGLNKYACQTQPDVKLLAFGSSTASTISVQSLDHVQQFWQQLLAVLETDTPPVVYARELLRIRAELLDLCELSDLKGLETVFAASGTDVHGIVARFLSHRVSVPTLIIMVEANETGSGVQQALTGHRCNYPAVEHEATPMLEVVAVPIRLTNGAPRPAHELDAEIEALVGSAVAKGRRVLVVLVDQSKTGLIAPSPACVLALQRRWTDQLEVLVDACQFRIAPPTLRAYLEQGCMVALTGSKFITGPAFSAVLLLPENVVQQFRTKDFPVALKTLSTRAEWPPTWDAAKVLADGANFGLLLRWEAALAELKRFRALPEAAVIGFVQAFNHAIAQRLKADAHFEILAVPPLTRQVLTTVMSWDHLQTIFPFLLYHPKTADGRLPLSRTETVNIYQQLALGLAPGNECTTIDVNQNVAMLRGQLGQPVACGMREGVPVSALRLCLSVRHIVEAAVSVESGDAVIENALAVLDKVAWLMDL